MPRGADGVCAGAGTPERVASLADATSEAPEPKINQKALAVWEIKIHSLTLTHRHTCTLFAILCSGFSTHLITSG